MKNQAWSLDENGEPVSRDASDEELENARVIARRRLDKDKADYAMRSCWNCNSAHTHFLEDLNDGFLFVCFSECGRWYYQGIDITIDDE